MTNSALFSSLNDTSGGTAKVGPGKFPYLAAIANLDLIGDFGEKYAAHKMKIAEPKADVPTLVRTGSSARQETLFPPPIAGKGGDVVGEQQETPKKKTSTTTIKK